MPIYLAQHGRNVPKEENPDRPLSGEGISEVTQIAETAAGYNVSVSKIIHSGKLRAKETAEIFSRLLKPPEGTEGQEGLSPMDPVDEFARVLDPDSAVLYVGHLPFMEKLVSYLTTGSEKYKIFGFRNGGIVCLDRDAESGLWHIKWTLMPSIG